MFYTLPNLITLGNLFCGVYSIYFSTQGKITYAAYFIFIAMIFDFLDGKIARLKNKESEIGVQLDSLTDVISFGIAPVVLFYMLSFKSTLNWVWLIAFLYVVCCAFRLARYNILSKKNKKKSIFFTGIPTPAAAGLVISFNLVYYQENFLLFTTLIMFLSSMLMISNIKYPNLNKINLNKKLLVFLIFIFTASIFLGYINIILMIAFISYAFSGLYIAVKQRIFMKTILRSID